MKVFVSDKKEQGYISPTDYHWCDDGDLLMFPQFSTGNGNPSEVYMVGIKSRKGTTHIVVKDLNITKDFLKELLTNSIEKSMLTKISDNGEYQVNLGKEWIMDFNINKILDEIVEKASKFEDGQKVICFGRNLKKINDI